MTWRWTGCNLIFFPVLIFSVVTSTSGTIQLFDGLNILTGQDGPGNATMTAALYKYRHAFVQMRLLGDRREGK